MDGRAKIKKKKSHTQKNKSKKKKSGIKGGEEDLGREGGGRLRRV